MIPDRLAVGVCIVAVKAATQVYLTDGAKIPNRDQDRVSDRFPEELAVIGNQER